VNIRVPRPALGAAVDGISGSYATPIGTPDLRALRAHYVGTPPPNIPPRGIVATPARTVSPFLPASGSATPISRNAVVAETSVRRADTHAHGTETPLPVDLDDFPEEEKAKVLRRHLVSKEERLKRLSNSDSGLPSRTPSPRRQTSIERKDTELFPVPYDAPGADITWVSL
jgi:proton-coupled amino acid transporter